jgi:hypothetical protein
VLRLRQINTPWHVDYDSLAADSPGLQPANHDRHEQPQQQQLLHAACMISVQQVCCPRLQAHASTAAVLRAAAPARAVAADPTQHCTHHFNLPLPVHLHLSCGCCRCCCNFPPSAGKQARGAAWQRKILLDLQDETAFSSTELQVSTVAQSFAVVCTLALKQTDMAASCRVGLVRLTWSGSCRRVVEAAGLGRVMQQQQQLAAQESYHTSPQCTSRVTASGNSSEPERGRIADAA